MSKTRASTWRSWVLITSALLFSAWLIRASVTSRIHHPQQQISQYFTTFAPAIPGWSARRIHVAKTALEPNILAYKLTADARNNTHPDSLLIRLVYGYNMVDCMRIKGYAIEPMERHVDRQAGQLWHLTSRDGARSLWITLMLHADTLSPSAIDTRAMAFPRIGTPDAPGWNPGGITVSGLRHPIRNIRYWFRARWNSSRRDLLTFLRLKRPAWVSERFLTLVIEGPAIDSQPDDALIESLRIVLKTMQTELEAHIRDNAHSI